MISKTSLNKIGNIISIVDFRNELIILYKNNFKKAIGCIGGLVKNGAIIYNGDYFVRIK